jgi:hypothetical protein
MSWLQTWRPVELPLGILAKRTSAPQLRACRPPFGHSALLRHVRNAVKRLGFSVNVALHKELLNLKTV